MKTAKFTRILGLLCMAAMLISVLLACGDVSSEAAHGGVDQTEPAAQNPDHIPSDFAFSIVWGCYGISSYDSKTGELVKTKDATDVSRYTAHVRLTEDRMKEVYRILLSDIDLFRYPDSYDPFNAPDAEIRVASTPSQTIIISVAANGRTKTVRCDGIAFGSPDNCYSEEAKAFMNAENKIVEMITSLPERAAFPEYELIYE